MTINVGEITDTNITVAMLSSSGSFNLAIEWPSEDVSSTVVSGLLRSDKQADIPLTFAVGTPKAGYNT